MHVNTYFLLCLKRIAKIINVIRTGMVVTRVLAVIAEGRNNVLYYEVLTTEADLKGGVKHLLIKSRKPGWTKVCNFLYPPPGFNVH
jgi:hypothetical protein